MWRVADLQLPYGRSIEDTALGSFQALVLALDLKLTHTPHTVHAQLAQHVRPKFHMAQVWGRSTTSPHMLDPDPVAPALDSWNCAASSCTCMGQSGIAPAPATEL